MGASTVDRYLRRPEVEHLTGLSRATIYKRMKAGNFPLARDLGGGAVRWVEEEVREWMDSRPLIHHSPKQVA